MKKLNEIPKNNPFKIPDNYFNEANRKIISAASGIEHDVVKISFYNRFRTSILIAASVAGFILISYSALKIFTHERPDLQVSEVFNDVNPDSLINEIDISSLEESASSLSLTGEGPDVSKKDIIDYLIFENIEINDIYEQL